jgi:hypothetical protein
MKNRFPRSSRLLAQIAVVVLLSIPAVANFFSNHTGLYFSIIFAAAICCYATALLLFLPLVKIENGMLVYKPGAIRSAKAAELSLIETASSTGNRLAIGLVGGKTMKVSLQGMSTSERTELLECLQGSVSAQEQE